MLDLHDSNARDRFPVGHRPVFEHFLDSPPSSFFVADAPEAGVVACGGVLGGGEQVHTLCYGLVAPNHQGRGIGSAMVLARLVFATRIPGTHFSFIFAVPKSIGFYQRFGFSSQQTWKGEDQKDYPIGVLSYSSMAVTHIEGVLRKRGLLINPSLPVAQDPSKIAIVTPLGNDQHRIEFKEKERNKASEPTPGAVMPRAN